MSKKLLTTILAVIALAVTTFAQPGANDPTFNPTDLGFGFGDGANGFVLTTTIQSDGKIIIGGGFFSYNGTPRNRIARINADGTLDNSFDPGTGANNSVSATAIQSDGKIIIGGSFTSYNGIAKNRIARLNADGTLENSFATGIGASGIVSTTAIQSDGKIIIGGDFTSYNGTARSRIARLNADGTLDNSFAVGTGANNSVRITAIQSDGKIIIGGNFTSYNGTAINRIARINADGTLDNSFNPGTGANGSVRTTAILSDGKIIIGGDFTSYNGTAINRIARLNADGTLDNSFATGTGASGIVFTTAIQSDGKIMIGGDFTSYNGTAINRIARLNADGTLDNSFAIGTGASGIVYTTAIQSDGKIMIGGNFNSYNGTGRSSIARLNADGTVDNSFAVGTGANSSVVTTAIQSDGKIIIGGGFNSYYGTVRNYIARLNANGTYDNSFAIGTGANNSGWVSTVWATAIQSDGKIMIVGLFESYNGTARNCIARLNADGTLDNSFAVGTGANNTVFTTAIQSDGKIMIGGWFTSYNGTARNYIARLNADGTLDNSFAPGTGADNYVWTTAIQSDGKIMIGGNFNSYNGTVRNYIARLNANGTLDNSFNPGTGANNEVLTTVIQSDGKIIIGGAFTSYNGTGRNYIARLNADGTLDNSFAPGIGANNKVRTTTIQSDGKIMIGGDFTSYNGTVINRIARLNADGTLDNSFNPGTGANSSVWTTAIQSDGKIIIGGDFLSYNGTGRNRVARILGGGGCETVSAASSTPTVCINTAITNITHTTTLATGIGAATGLPAGVTASWASNTITISGTPTASGTFNYSIPLTGNCGTVSATGTITVTPDNTVSAASSTPTVCINTAITNITHTTTLATGIGAATGLPAGVTASWASNTITISGTPTVSGTFNYSIPLTGGCGTVTATGTITVTPSSSITLSSAVGTDAQTVCINNAIVNITYAVTGATGATVTGLPAGVTGNYVAGVVTISGTPTASGTFNYTITLTGGCGTVTATGTITVTTNNTAGASTPQTRCINTALSPNLTHTTTGATGIGAATGLPAGVTASWASNTITISGTPTASGTFNYSIPLTGGCGTTVNATGTITVTPSNTGTALINACDTYTWIDGVTYTSSNSAATYVLTNQVGCDSTVTLNLTINNSNIGTALITACDTYTWIDGLTYTSSNSAATYVLTNQAGCDSTVTLNLTINNSNTGTALITACDTYTWIDGVTYTSSNSAATYVLTNQSGCDSTVTLNITINNSNTSTALINACNSYTWIDGNTYTTSNNTATYTLTNALGCDSIVTLNLTIASFVTGTDVVTACNSFTWIDGNTYSSNNNTATFTIVGGSVNGCDSIVTLNLTIASFVTGIDVVTACNSYTWIDGNTFTSSNNSATFTIVGGSVNGCDSIVTLNLTINSANTSVTQGLGMLTANATGAAYQWLDCDNGFVAIVGETNQSFTPTLSGNYAALITENGCTDSSACFNVFVVGLNANNNISNIGIYPNPVNDIFTVQTTKPLLIEIYSLEGNLIENRKVNGNYSFGIGNYANGMYLIKAIDNIGGFSYHKLVKQ